MFAAGIRLRQEFGPDAVCDFSIGNPDVPAPPQVKEGLLAIAAEAEKPMAFGYTAFPGDIEARQAMAAYLTKEQCVPVAAEDVFLSPGAGGVIFSML